MAEVYCVATSIAKPGFEECLQQALQALVDPVRNEAGALQYDLHRDQQNPRRFVILERWTDAASFQAHTVAPHIEAYKQKAGAWLEFAEFFTTERLA